MKASRIQWGLALLLLAIHAVAAWLIRPPMLTPQSNDDGLYLLLSRSLRHLKYVDTHVVGVPFQSQYPPGYPAILAVTGALFGDGLDVAHATTILCSVLALLILFDLARRLIGGWPAVGLLAAVALNNKLLAFASSLASEPPYLMWSLLTVWALVVMPEGPRRLWIAGAASLMAGLTRSVGIAMVAAVLVLWILERRYRPAMIYAIAASATVGVWMVWTTLAPDKFTERSYAAVLYKPIAHHRGFLEVAWLRFSAFFKIYFFGSTLAGLENPTIQGTSIDNAIWLALVLGLGLLGLVLMWRRARIIPLYLAFYIGILFTYPFKLTRFYMPLVPLQLLAMLVGLTWLSRRWPRVVLPLSLAITLPIAASTARFALGLVAEAGRCRRESTATNPQCFPAPGRAFLAAVRYATDSLPPGAAVLTIKESPFYYYTGHRVMHPQLPVAKARDHVLSFMTERGVNYILLSAYPGGGLVASVLKTDCQHLEQVFTMQPWTYLLRIQRPGEPPPAVDGCDAITLATIHTKKSGDR